MFVFELLKSHNMTKRFLFFLIRQYKLFYLVNKTHTQKKKKEKKSQIYVLIYTFINIVQYSLLLINQAWKITNTVCDNKNNGTDLHKTKQNKTKQNKTTHHVSSVAPLFVQILPNVLGGICAERHPGKDSLKNVTRLRRSHISISLKKKKEKKTNMYIYIYIYRYTYIHNNIH